MGFLLNLGRVFLGIVNIIFLLIGIVLLIIGLIAKFGNSFKSYYERVILELEAALSSAGFSNSSIDLDLAQLVGGLATGLIISGVLVIILSLTGIIGAVRKTKCLLLLYGLVIFLLVAAQIITMGIFYSKPEVITNPIKDSLNSTIKTDYRGFNGTNMVSIGWNFVNHKFSCCGIDSYYDFTDATNWVYSYPAISATLLTPISCCKTLPSSNIFACAESPLSASTNNFDTGCFSEIWNIVLGNLAITLPVMIGCITIQIIFFATVVCLYRDDKSKVRPMKPGKRQRNSDGTDWDF